MAPVPPPPPGPVHQFIAGRRALESDLGGSPGPAHPVLNPATGETIAHTDLAPLRAAEAAIRAAAEAFPAWAARPVGDRCQVIFKYKQLLEQHFDELAAGIVREHGKTSGEAAGDVRRGIDCVEFACAAPVLLMGRTLPQIAVSSSFCRTEDKSGVGIDSAVDRVPLGVCIGITPFNFPVMVPLWMWPMAVACGNTFILKPSEKVPLSALREVELAHEAGLPPGVLNLVTGGPAVAEFLITHEETRAVSFVGSTKVAHHIYKTATAAGKRAQCMGGAKNYMVIMPDANRDAVIEGVVGSAFGNTGQRCLAGSVAIAVGEAAEWFIPRIREAAGRIKVGPGDAAGCTMGPVIDEPSRARILGFIDSGVQDGASLVLDGRACALPASGWFVGPTVFDNARPGMRIIEEEIFGPVLSIMRESTLDAALSTLNRSRYGNMAVIFTSSGYNARRFKTHAQVGMVGINVGVPAPMAAFPFSGWKHSFFGDLHANGEDAARFYTESKVVVTRWM
ncbi:MAG: CoA-acylating methylmalonate-semialdehyde dehydrogenase [Phycisphaerales bacterium]|nr:CoA-acylating methylmalonate-semialdehyde dehydrogenase [Phycisphaerales bacterium]